MARPTFRTVPLPNIQRHFIYNAIAVPALFGARKPLVNFNQFSSVPLTFVGKLTDKFTLRSITNTLCQLVVFHHIFDCQILNHDGLVFTYQLSRQLMQKILAAISYLPMYSCYLLPLFVSIMGLAQFW